MVKKSIEHVAILPQIVNHDEIKAGEVTIGGQHIILDPIEDDSLCEMPQE
jgi:hypothetical protein